VLVKSNASARRSPDWIESFLAFTDAIPSPAIFRKWAAISAIAGALQRRVYVQTAQSLIFPNLYVLLVSPPGIGKSEAIKRVGEIWHAADHLHVAPNSVTRASLLDILDKSQVKNVLPSGDLDQFHALTVAASEFGVLVPAHDLEFLNTLNDIYDCPPSFREVRRARTTQIDISFPILNILGGTQPAYLASLLPEEAWGMGFTSRLIMVYSAQQVRVSLFGSRGGPDVALAATLKADLEGVVTMYGEMKFSPEAEALLVPWFEAGLPPIPTHSRLQNYNTRRILHVIKLAMVSSASRDNALIIEPVDIERARDWLLEAETLMPDIFRDMAGKSDKAVIDDLHSYLWRIYARDQQPIHEQKVISFLSARMPSEKILRLIDLCERSGVLVRMAGTGGTSPAMYKPALLTEMRGVE
jgi:hypothetical protein